MTNGNKIIFGFIRFAFGILLALIVIYFAQQLAVVGYDFGYRVFTEKPMAAGEGREVPVLISEDMSDAQISQMLKEKGLIRDVNLFVLQMKLFDYSGKLIPGVYTVNTNMDPKELMIALSTADEPELQESVGE